MLINFLSIPATVDGFRYRRVWPKLEQWGQWMSDILRDNEARVQDAAAADSAATPEPEPPARVFPDKPQRPPNPRTPTVQAG